MMSKNYKHYHTAKTIFLLVGIFFIAACSRKKDKFLNRNFHAMGTYYNIIYNGNLVLNEGRQEVIQGYRDDFWNILPVERMSIEEVSMEDVDTPEEGDEEEKNASKFEVAEEKATKAIQKHNMLIDGIEYNYKIDEAFLLLGKSRYYDQRFFPALEAFNYILTRYDESSEMVTAKVWREKAYMRMDNNELALENLSELLSENIEFEEEDYADANATMAQAYINLEELENAMQPLDSAIVYTPSDEERGRFLFIKGQLYDRLGQKDSANKAFDEVIALNRKSPRVYMINAYMQKAKNFDFESGDRVAQYELLRDLEEDRENRPFLDIIYYGIAEYFMATDSLEGGIENYNKSLREDSEDEYLRSRNYLTLGNINFDRAEYKTAGAYYDSTLTNLAENSREFRAIRKKRENLDDVILYEDIAYETDSILHFAEMSDPEKLDFYTAYTDSLKTIAIAEAEKAAKEAKRGGTTGNMFGTQQSTAGGGNQNKGGGFYFYNSTQAALGEEQFNRVWGNRELKDNWRYETGSGNRKKEEDEEGEEAVDFMAQIEADPKYDPQTYIAEIPTDPKVIDSISDERNFAYYQLGIIYKEKFKEYNLASDKLEALLQNDPEERLVLPSKYNLYKIYTATENTAKANQWKNNILENHPDSRYATILRNPRGLVDDKNSPEAVYTQVYRLYEAENYQKVIDQCDKNIGLFTGEDIVPKFELLKATALGKHQGLEAYEEALNYVALNYPQSEEGKRAEEIVSNTIPKLKKTKFEENSKERKYKLVYPFRIENRIEADSLQKTLKKAFVELGYENLKISIDKYTAQQDLLVVHGLKSKLGAEGLGDVLEEHEDYEIMYENFGISSTNYKTVQMHKNLDAYLQQQTE